MPSHHVRWKSLSYWWHHLESPFKTKLSLEIFRTLWRDYIINFQAMPQNNQITQNDHTFLLFPFPQIEVTRHDPGLFWDPDIQWPEKPSCELLGGPVTFSGTRETFFLGTKLQGFQRWPTFSGFQSWGSQKTGPVLVVFGGFVGDDISYPGCSGNLCKNFCKRMRAQVYIYIYIYIYHDTVDGMNPANSPVEGTVVEIPLFTGFHTC